MKAAHLPKIEARRERVLQLLLPDAVPRGEIASPEDRLRELVLRLNGRDVFGPEFPLRTAVANVRQLLEEDIPELMDAVREAQGAQRKYCRYCGERRLGLLAASHDDNHSWECRDEDGCEARISRKGQNSG